MARYQPLNTWLAQEMRLRKLRSKVRPQPPIQDTPVFHEYLRVQDDLEAYLNPPHGLKLGDVFWDTVTYLERRLDDLEVQLLQQAS
jgi:hypothetical protein